jgi:putative nucleotidyltransferase with HDIG domain
VNTSTLTPLVRRTTGMQRDTSPAVTAARPGALTGDRPEEIVEAPTGLSGHAGEFGGRTLKFLLSALRTYDPDTYDHSVRTSRLCVLLGRECGLAPAQLRALRLGALLHDVGKVYVPREALRAPGALTDEGWAAMRCHPRNGQRLLIGITGLADAARIVLHHHESWDGSGYPQGLSGEAIEFNARIVAVADAFDSMVSDRPYRLALTYEAATAELNRCAGTQFDALVVEVFYRVTRGRIATNMRRSSS